MRGFGVDNEFAIRSALKSDYLRHHRGRSDVLIIDELGLAHAQSRVDVAVFNGHLHGYEIKSANDSLDRLPRQLEIYSASLQKLTMVVATRHVNSVTKITPEWCGVVEVCEGPRRGVMFATHRRASVNRSIDPFMLAHLLWRSEAQLLLRQIGGSAAEIKAPRKQLYRRLADEMPVRQLAAAVKSAMESRTAWRDRQQLQ